MKTRLFLSALLLGAASQARAAVDIGSDAQLFATAHVSVDQNDNVFLSNTNAKSLTIIDLAPGFQVTMGKNSLTTANLTFVEDIKTYSSSTSLNSNLATAMFNLGFDDTKMKVALDASWMQADQANRDVIGAGFLVKRDVSHVGLNDEVNLTDKTSFGIGGMYNNTDYKRVGYADLQVITVPLKYYYKVTAKTDVSAGFTYLQNQLGTGGVDSKEYFYNVGARGEFGPKITGEFSVGYTQRKPKVGHSTSTLGLKSNFIYAATEKTSATFGLSNGYGYSGTGSSYRIATVNAGIESALTTEFKVNAGLSYSRYNYTSSTQTDKFSGATLGGSYLVNGFLTVNAGYRYSKNDSTLAGTGFASNIFTISADLRY